MISLFLVFMLMFTLSIETSDYVVTYMSLCRYMYMYVIMSLGKKLIFSFWTCCFYANVLITGISRRAFMLLHYVVMSLVCSSYSTQSL